MQPLFSFPLASACPAGTTKGAVKVGEHGWRGRRMTLQISFIAQPADDRGQMGAHHGLPGRTASKDTGDKLAWPVAAWVPHLLSRALSDLSC